MNQGHGAYELNSRVFTFIGMEFLKGLQFRVVQSSDTEMNEIVLWQTSGSNDKCGASVKWKSKICKGCNCAESAGGLMHNDIATSQVDTVKDEKPLGECRTWFMSMDSLFRKYFATMRAQVLVLKAACCDPLRTKGPKHVRSDGGTFEGSITHTWAQDICNSETFDQNKETRILRKEASAERLRTDHAMELDKRAALMGESEASQVEAATGSDASSTTGSDYKDVTDAELAKMSLSCKYHVHAGAETLGTVTYGTKKGGSAGCDLPGCSDNQWKGWKDLPEDHTKQAPGSGSTNNPEGTKLDLTGLGGRPELYGKITCAEADYPRAAQVAFAPAGDRFFPPKITKASSTTLELSCGTEEVQLDMYEASVMRNNHPAERKGVDCGNTNGQNADEVATPDLCKDKDGNTVQGTLGMFKLDGGQFSDGANMYGSYAAGKYRPANSHSSNTCCPPLGLGMYAKNSNYILADHHDKTKYGRPIGFPNIPLQAGKRLVRKQFSDEWWQSTNSNGELSDNGQHDTKAASGDAEACFRYLYGHDTEQCKSTLTLKIQVCDCDSGPLTSNGGNKCKNADGNLELVKMTISHQLDTPGTANEAAHIACNPWFTMMDAGVRAYIAKFRQQLNDATAAQCLA
jgi:hypothetical protein